MSMRMLKSTLLDKVSKEEREKLVAHINGAEEGFAFLAKIIKNRIDFLEKEQCELSIYTTSAYTHKVADLNGCKRELRSLLHLITGDNS